ncbi:cytochrome c oxidase subunit II [Baekduia soli]|uniref:Cytochrome c oxidase subunit 2 n=1 Tax=Baekduia soli TaxID=496014 RepID=A0A5B8UA40_9ACTN|nr:cytochrome c oxidase subunit II [Baekduia soli]QEC49905.1 cytochrome c oxidase subunit II [Baekduia soli]
MTPRRAIPALLVALAAALVLAPVASAGLLTPEHGGSSNADDINWLYTVTLIVAAIVFLGVEGVLLYSVFKFKARRGAVPAQIRGNTRLEIGWTVGAAVILVILATLTFIKLDDIRNPPDSSATGLQLADSSRRLPPNGKSLNICVNGQQYIWRYTYSADCGDSAKNLGAPFSYEEMVVPVDTTVTLDIKAQDVAHSWWIPELGGKFDAIPGYTNHTWFKIPAKFGAKPGGTIFYGQCAELCGRNHANMIAEVRAVSVAEYQQWLAQRKTDIQDAETKGAAQRKQLESGSTTP